MAQGEAVALQVLFIRYMEQVEALLLGLAYGHGVVGRVHGDHGADACGRGEDGLVAEVVDALAIGAVVGEESVLGDLHGTVRAGGDLHRHIALGRRNGLLPHGQEVEKLDIILIQHAVVAVNGLGEHAGKKRGQRPTGVHVVGIEAPLGRVAARAPADLLQDGLVVPGVQHGGVFHASNPSIPVPSSV